ncbi:MAG: PH domain-containing protein [Euryarchaeota archaeon]|nr:PH domain-containing protein [Euryarchaeota archaeon]
MASYPRRFFLLRSERMLVEARMARAWGFEHMLATLVLAAIVWGGLTAFVVFGGPPAPGLWLLFIAAGAALHLVASLVYVWRRVATSEYVVTDEAVYARRGNLLLHVDAAALDRVTDLHVRTTLVGRIFGYSGLAVRTAGGGVYLPGLRDPYTIRGIIQNARHDFIARLLRESGRSRSEPASPHVSTECECPNCGAVLPVPPRRPIDVECPRCHERGMLFEEAPA